RRGGRSTGGPGARPAPNPPAQSPAPRAARSRPCRTTTAAPYELPFDPKDRPPTWLVPLAAVRRSASILGVICKGCGRRRRWPVDELIERYGARRMVQDLWIRWRCSKCRSADCLPFTLEYDPDADQR